jgi:hypothetical protein
VPDDYVAHVVDVCDRLSKNDLSEAVGHAGITNIKTNSRHLGQLYYSYLAFTTASNGE